MTRSGGGMLPEAVVRWVRYAALATLVTLCVTSIAWLTTGPDARRGILLAGAIALPLQLMVFAGMLIPRKGTPAFLGMWVGGTFGRLLAVGGAAWLAAVNEAFEPAATLLTLVGLLFVLLLLEPWVLRETS